MLVAPPNNPLVARVALIFARDTRQFVNTYHVVKVGGWFNTDLSTLAQTFETWFSTYQKLFLPVSTALVQIQIRVYDPANPLALDYSVVPPIPGQTSGTMLPGSVTATQSWRTGLAGKKNRGRTYVPGFVEAAVGDDDRVNSATVIQMATAALQLLIALEGNDTPLVIFHRATNLVTGVITFIVENIVDNQRRRLPGRGR